MLPCDQDATIGEDGHVLGMAATDGDLSPMQFGTRFAGGWSEAWDFVACGRRATVTVRFEADGKGGASARVTDVTLS